MSFELRTVRCPECARVASVPEWCRRPICVHAWNDNGPEVWDGDDCNDGEPIECTRNPKWRTPGSDTWAEMLPVIVFPDPAGVKLPEVERPLTGGLLSSCTCGTLNVGDPPPGEEHAPGCLMRRPIGG